MNLFAYLDAGSASALLAAVLAGFAGIGAAVRTYGRRLMFWKKDEPATEVPAKGAEAAKTDQVDDKPAEQ